MQSYAPALAEAEAAYRKVLRHIFLYATAVDAVSSANRLGVFLDAARYALHVPLLPRHEAFDSLTPNRFQAHEDFMQLQKEAEAAGR